MSTAATILGLAFNQLRVEQGGTDVPGLSVADMLAVLDKANQEWQRVFRREGGAPLIARRGETGIDLLSTTTLAADIAANAASLTATDSSAFASSGAAAIWDQNDPDLLEFSRSSNAWTVSGIDWAHESGDTLQQLYALPSNFDSFRSEESNPSGVTLGGVPLRYTTDPPGGLSFALYDNGATKYLWPSRGLTGSLRIVFNKSTTTIDDTGDSLDIPSEYDWFAVNRLIAHGKRSLPEGIVVIGKVRYPNGDLVDEDDHKADQILVQAQKERNVGKAPKVRPIGFSRNYGLYNSNFRET